MILAASWYHTILAFFFAVLCIVLIIVILLQRGRGVGLAGAFGGAGGTTAFGSKTGDILTWVTIIGAALLLTFTTILNYVFVEETGPILRPSPVAPAAPMVPGGTTVPPPMEIPASPAPTPTPQDADQTGAWHWPDGSLSPGRAGLSIFGEHAA